MQLAEVGLHLLLRGILQSDELFQHCWDVYFRLVYGVHNLLKAPIVRYQFPVQQEADLVVTHGPGEVPDAVAAVEQQTVASWAKIPQTGCAVLAKGISTAELAQV